MGVGLGLFMGAMGGDTSAIEIIKGKEVSLCMHVYVLWACIKSLHDELALTCLLDTEINICRVCCVALRGLFLISLSSIHYQVPPAPLREQMRSGYKATGAKAVGWAKQFGVLTALFGGVECVVEKYRAKHDVWNPVISGCAVGATLSASGGPGVCTTHTHTLRQTHTY